MLNAPRFHSAERGNASHTRKHQGHTHLDHEVMLDLPPMNTTQKVEQVKAYFSAVGNPHSTLHQTVKDTKGCRLGRVSLGWVKQTTQYCKVCQLTELKQTKEWERYPNRFRRLNETLLPENLLKALLRMASRQNRVRDQASHSRKQQTARPHSGH